MCGFEPEMYWVDPLWQLTCMPSNWFPTKVYCFHECLLTQFWLFALNISVHIDTFDWCYWIALPVSPVVQSSNTVSCVSLTVLSHTPVRSRFYHIHIVYKRDWNGSFLMNLTQKSKYFSNSQFVPLRWVLVKHAIWGTRHGNGVADCAVAKLLRLWQHASALWRHAVWIRIVTSHSAWIGYEYSLPNVNRPRAIHKHNPHPIETMDQVW